MADLALRSHLAPSARFVMSVEVAVMEAPLEAPMVTVDHCRHQTKAAEGTRV